MTLPHIARNPGLAFGMLLLILGRSADPYHVSVATYSLLKICGQPHLWCGSGNLGQRKIVPGKKQVRKRQMATVSLRLQQALVFCIQYERCILFWGKGASDSDVSFLRRRPFHASVVESEGHKAAGHPSCRKCIVEPNEETHAAPMPAGAVSQWCCWPNRRPETFDEKREKRKGELEKEAVDVESAAVTIRWRTLSNTFTGIGWPSMYISLSDWFQAFDHKHSNTDFVQMWPSIALV